MYGKKMISKLLSVIAFVFVQSAHAGVYSNVNGGSLIVSIDFGHIEIYKSADCYWNGGETGHGRRIACKKGSNLPREVSGELIKIDKKEHYLLIMNGVISEGPKCTSCLIWLTSIKGFNEEGVNVLAIVDYNYNKERAW